MEKAKPGVERRSGIALWRQIADEIRRGVTARTLAPDGRLPPELDLASRFGVNRHTVRAAIASLVQEGVLRAEQGRGTFVETRRRLAYPIGRRTRFSAGLEGQAQARSTRLVNAAVEPATSALADMLGLETGASVIRLETLSSADGKPVSRGQSFVDARRFAGFDDVLARTGSITASFREFGIGDYVRRSTTVTARHADAADVADLALSPGAIVLVTAAIDAQADGPVIQYAETRFAADRVELVIGG